MTVNDRRQNILQSSQFCEEGCEMKSINYTLNTVDCECNTKTDGFSSIFEENEIIGNIKELLSNYNFNLFLCYNLPIKGQNLVHNYGNWIILAGMIYILTLFIIFVFLQMNKVYSSINKFFPSCPSIHQQNYLDNSVKLYSESTKDIFPTKTQHKSENIFEIKKDENNDQLSSDELNELDYENAIKDDKREYCLSYCHILFEKQIFLSTFMNSSVFYPISLRLIMLIFTLMAFCFFNALFFTEEDISNRNNSKFQINFVYFVKSEIAKSVYTSFLGILITKIMVIVTSIKGEFSKIIQTSDSQNEQHIKLYKLMKSFKKRIAILLIIIVILSAIFWYFLVIFCRLYKNTQIYWILSTLLSITLNIIIPIILCFIFGTLKYCGKKYKNQIVFKIGQIGLDFF